MNRSQKFLGITLMASLLCGFTPMQSEAKEYKIGGMYTYDYHDGRHADWGEYELHAAKMAIEDINASGMLGGNTLDRRSRKSPVTPEAKYHRPYRRGL